MMETHDISKENEFIKFSTSNTIIYAIFFSLPLEKFLVINLGGFNLRLVYIFMIVFSLFYIKYLKLNVTTLILVSAVVLASTISGINAINMTAWLASLAFSVLTTIFSLVFISYTKLKRSNLENIIRIFTKTANFWVIIIIVQWIAAFFIAHSRILFG